MFVCIKYFCQNYRKKSLHFQSCQRTALKYHSHSRLTSWCIVAVQWACCKPILIVDNKPETKHERNINLLNISSKSNQNQIKEWLQIYLVTTLSKSKPQLSVELVKFSLGCDAVKIMNKTCISTLCNMAKVHSPITSTNFNTQNISFAI